MSCQNCRSAIKRNIQQLQSILAVILLQNNRRLNSLVVGGIAALIQAESIRSAIAYRYLRG